MKSLKKKGNNERALFIATEKGNSKAVNEAVAKCTLEEVNWQSSGQQRTSLHVAVSKLALLSVKILLSYKANPNLSDTYGLTALHLAAESGAEAICRALLSHGASANCLTTSKVTPLHMAAANGYIDVCKLLLNCQADIDARDENLRTPLHESVFYQQESSVLFLLHYRANVEKRAKTESFFPDQYISESNQSDKWITPLELAQKLKCSEQIIRCLQERKPWLIPKPIAEYKIFIYEGRDIKASGRALQNPYIKAKSQGYKKKLPSSQDTVFPKYNRWLILPGGTNEKLRIELCDTDRLSKAKLRGYAEIKFDDIVRLPDGTWIQLAGLQKGELFISVTSMDLYQLCKSDPTITIHKSVDLSQSQGIPDWQQVPIMVVQDVQLAVPLEEVEVINVDEQGVITEVSSKRYSKLQESNRENKPLSRTQEVQRFVASKPNSFNTSKRKSKAPLSVTRTEKKEIKAISATDTPAPLTRGRSSSLLANMTIHNENAHDTSAPANRASSQEKMDLSKLSALDISAKTNTLKKPDPLQLRVRLRRQSWGSLSDLITAGKNSSESSNTAKSGASEEVTSVDTVDEEIDFLDDTAYEWSVAEDTKKGEPCIKKTPSMLAIPTVIKKEKSKEKLQNTGDVNNTDEIQLRTDRRAINRTVKSRYKSHRYQFEDLILETLEALDVVCEKTDLVPKIEVVSSGLDFIGEYKIEGSIGKGAFGSVYQAVDPQGQRVAIKRIPGNSAQRECPLLKSLNCKNIVKFINILKGEDDQTFVVQELVEGGTLSKQLQTVGPLPEFVIARYLAQLLVGINYLHGRGIIHRDIKSDNVLLAMDGTVKLADFGLAEMPIDVETSPMDTLPVLTQAEILRRRVSRVDGGSPYWVAPEVVQSSVATPKTDIWSLGATVYEMLTGHPPFWGNNIVLVMINICCKEIPIPETTSPELRDFLQKTFTKNEAQRPSAKELMDHHFLKIHLPGFSSDVAY